MGTISASAREASLLRAAFFLLIVCFCSPWTHARASSLPTSLLPARGKDSTSTAPRRRLQAQGTWFRTHRTVTYYAETVTTGRIFLSKGSGSSLEDPLDLQSLKVARLLSSDSEGQAGAATSKEDANCLGDVCPSFGSCAGRGLQEVSSCYNKELAPEAAQEIVYTCPRPPWDIHEAVIRRSECLDQAANESSADLVASSSPHVADSTPVADESDLRSPWAGQVVVLQDVFVDRLGRVFNATHRFHFGGCPSTMNYPQDTPEAPTSFPKGSRLLVYPELVNLMLEPQSLSDTGFHEIGMKLPLFLSLSKLFIKLQDLPWAIHRRQTGLWHGTLGSRAPLRRLQSTKGSSLLLVKKLYQPLLPPCNKPSSAQWQALRSNHLLHPEGLPLFDATGRLRHVAPLEDIGPQSRGPYLDHTWVVVVSVRHPDPEIEQHMRFVAEVASRLFTADRVVLYAPGISHVATKKLFNRALLFIAPSGSSLANMAFMPFHTTVVEVQLSKPGSSPEADIKSRVYERMARAAGLVHYYLPCTAAEATTSDHSVASLFSGGGSISRFCSVEFVQSALETVQHDIFKNFWLVPRMLDSEGRGFKNRIPGTRVDTLKKLVLFRKWQQCVVEKGKWVLDEQPRLLPWDIQAGLSVCDIDHAKKGGLAGPEANKAVRAGVDPAKWTVRQALKYSWQVPEECGLWEPFSRKGLIYMGTGTVPTLRGGRGLNILFLGDSLAGQLSKSFLNNVQNLDEQPKKSHAAPQDGLQECVDWIYGKSVRQPYCRFDMMKQQYMKNVTVNFIRNDQLLINGNAHNFMSIPFVRMKHLAEADVIIMNKGAHPRSNKHYVEHLRSTLKHLRLKYPDTLIIYRSTPSGHPGCANLKLPTDKPDLNFQGKFRTKFKWHTFAEQNQLAKKLVEEVGGVYVDIDKLTSFRQDGHPGPLNPTGEDCLHYCMPGPIDTWVQMLYNVILRTVPR